MKYNVIYKENDKWLIRAENVSYKESLNVLKRLYIEGKECIEIIRV